MRVTFFFILSSLIFTISAGGSLYYSPLLFSPPDTMPPPPQGLPSPLTGPASACVGESSEYAVDVPVSCTCQWSVNGVIQPGTSSPIIITWTQPGVQAVSVVFYCENGEISDPESISVDVFQTPEPETISGDDLVCEYTYHTYSIIVGPLDSCQWTVNGVIQSGYAPSITYSFGASGTYQFEVIAFNPCGTSTPQTLEVTAQGSAPDPPSPVIGPEESCEGNTDIYTTTVGAGESCAWWIDGIQQSTTTTTLQVTWPEWGDHIIEVRAISECGTGNPAFKDIQVLYQPAVFLGNDTTILQGKTLVIDAGNPGSDYLWSTGAVTQTITVSITGTYRVYVLNFCGADADTIDISVIVGIAGSIDPSGCFNVNVDQRRINITGLPQHSIKIQVINLSGISCYDGPPVGEISVKSPGIYLVGVISPEITCYKKVFIP